MSLDFCLETNMLKLSYKHLELSYYCYFHVFSIVKTTLCISLRKPLRLYNIFYNLADFDCIFALIAFVHKIMYFEYLL